MVFPAVGAGRPQSPLSTYLAFGLVRRPDYRDASLTSRCGEHKVTRQDRDVLLLNYGTVKELGTALAARKISALELIDHVIARVEARDQKLNAIVVRDFERAREAARQFLEIARRGPHFTGDPGSISREELHERR